MKSRESSSFTLSSTLLHIFPRDRSRHGNVRKGRRSSLLYLLYALTRPRIVDNSGKRIERKETRGARFGCKELRGLWNLAFEASFVLATAISLFEMLPFRILQPFPIISPSRFSTTIMGRSVVSRCNGSNLDRLYPRAGSPPPKVPPHPRPCRLEPGNRNCSFLLSIR